MGSIPTFGSIRQLKDFFLPNNGRESPTAGFKTRLDVIQVKHYPKNNDIMRTLVQKHISLWAQRAFLLNVLLGLVLLGAGISATYYANFYTSIHASNSVTDIILDNVPVVNVDFVFNEGAMIFFVCVALLLIYEPRRIPFVLKSIAIFYIIRSIFMMLTHLAPPFNALPLDAGDLITKLSSGLSSGNDLFFSAHTGLPFLLAIIFWGDKLPRYFFLFSAALGGTSVLLGHLHYSIDVFSALFISFGIFYIAKMFFKKDYVLFSSRE